MLVLPHLVLDISISTLQTPFHSQVQAASGAKTLRPAAHSPLTSVPVIAHDVLQGLHEDVLPGLLQLTFILPVHHSVHLFPWAQGLSRSAFTIVVEEGLVIEEASGLKTRNACLGPGHSGIEEAQRVRLCEKKKRENIEMWGP